MIKPASPTFGISSISTYRPPLTLPNSWFRNLPRKFEAQTGITERAISFESEAEMAVKAIDSLMRKNNAELRNCRALIVVSPSLVPMSVAARYLAPTLARHEQPTRVAHCVANRIGIRPRHTIGINSFCSGFARALQLLIHRHLPGLQLSEREFALVVCSNRISRIANFDCPTSGALFGDFAAATMVTRTDNSDYPVRYQILDAQVMKKRVSNSLFDFCRVNNARVVTESGGHSLESSRLVFSLAGIAIAEAASRGMAEAAASCLSENGLSTRDVRAIVPHQAGTGIVRLAALKLQDIGFTTTPVANGLTKKVGNISSCSVPFALKREWNNLQGNILCPVAAVGRPGKKEISQGCILLRRVDN